MSTYFITGGLGFLGQYIVKALHDHDPQSALRVLVRTPRQTFLNIESLERVHLRRGELTRPETFAAELAGVDTVIHNAALVSFKPEDADALYRSNVIGTQRLIEAALANGCKSFIYISSISTIGRKAGHLADESLLPDLEEKHQHDPYGYSKRLGEIEVQKYAEQIRVITLNPSVIIGPGSRRIEKSLQYLRWLPFLPMIPTINSFVDVRDVAKAVVLALRHGQSGNRYIVTNCNVEMPAFARIALQSAGLKRPVLIVPPAAIRLADSVIALLTRLRLNPGTRSLSSINVDKAYSTEKIRRDMGWAPDYSLEQSLTDTLAS
ncbi:MAG: NAD-dependent epimerase/dehydratase family protein [Chloroflexota bacterium]